MAGPLSTIRKKLATLTERQEDAVSKGVFEELELKEFQGFARFPIPHEFGDFNAARSVLKGEMVVLGQRFKLADVTPWDLELPSHLLTMHLHRFDWLGEFAALSSKAARGRAVGWLMGWLDRFSEGRGPGWTPEVVSERLLNIVTHMDFLTDAIGEDAEPRVIAALSNHFAYIQKTMGDAPGTIERIITLLNQLHCAVCFIGFESEAQNLQLALEQECGQHLNGDGTISSRNPAQLLHLFQKLIWTAGMLETAGMARGPAHSRSIQLIAPVLRALRHGDGSLARFHGSSGLSEGELDRALAQSKVRSRAQGEASMGYVRLQSSRLVAIMDCARPPAGRDAMTAHASTLAFELSSGRQPIIVNCGSGVTFGADWARSPRTTPLHSGLALDKTSSSQLAPKPGGPDPHEIELTTRPSMVTVSQAGDHSGSWLQARQDGYIEDYGLLHERRLFIGAMGGEAHGEDVLFSPEAKAERRFAQRIKGAEQLGVGLSIHFHIHPDVVAKHQRDTDTVRLSLPNGEVWGFRQTGGQVDLETSAYLDPKFAEPLPTKQIVLRARATKHKAEVSWSFTRQKNADPLTRVAAAQNPVDADEG